MGGRPSESRAYLKGRTLADIRERSKRLAPSADPVNNVVVDYTPHYAMVPEVPYRICHLLDCRTTKFIVLLRDPVERAISSWRFKERYKLKRNPEAYSAALSAMRAGQPTTMTSHRHAPELLTESMERGMAKAAEWLACVEVEVAAAALNVTADAIDLQLCNAVRLFEGQAAYEVPSDGSLSLRDHVGKSVYYLQLWRWLSLVPRQQLKVLYFEDLIKDTRATIFDGLTFMGLDPLASRHHEVAPANTTLYGESGRLESSGADNAKWHASDHLSLEFWDSVLSKRYNPTRRIPELEDQVAAYDRDALRRFYAPLNAALDDLLMANTGYFSATGT
eukprot:TRINITY_DN2394_c0_g1_i1.p1 TRINITY_DN2394_c0_g1~~TRINITY_DN2394_c0_g1_i1.p1  ORF type:complete len:334 (-),score=98.38 TRINITY_DN2394_c0_g1_i1:598-1599(-)